MTSRSRLRHPKRLVVLGSLMFATASVLVTATGMALDNQSGQAGSNTAHGQSEACKDPSDDPAGCQPSTFDTPIGEIPGGRVDRSGKLDPTSSKQHAIAGAMQVAKQEGLFRNLQWLHWVPTVPSERDAESGEWSGGDLEAQGDARGIGISSDCIYVGHRNGEGVFRDIDIFQIQPDPEKDPPVRVGEIPAFVDGNRGFDDRELRSLQYTSTDGADRMLMVRDATTRTQGKLETFIIDPETCLPIDQSNTYDFGGQSHEFFLWHDPNNPNRVLVFMTMWNGAGRPDPNRPGTVIPDIKILAITDEDTGDVLADPHEVAGFKLEHVGGPVQDEEPDETGLFADGRFQDFSHLTDSWGRSGESVASENNQIHSGSASPDGERFYVAGGTAGFYVLNTEAVAHNTNASLAAEKAECNLRSTNVWVEGDVGGDIDIAKLNAVRNDCVHMVINDDPGVQALLGSDVSDQDKLLAYMRLMDRSRLDVHPPFPSSTSIHSAVFVPDGPSLSRNNADKRPAYVLLADENNSCPLQHSRIASVESEVTPMMAGAFAVPDNLLEECLTQDTTEPDGTAKQRRLTQLNHNPTVFENLVFQTMYGQGLRVIEISNPHTPREVGHAITVPWGNERSYPVFKDGLIYWTNSSTGLHVAKYTGPRAAELPGRGSGVVEGNATSPHR